MNPSFARFWARVLTAVGLFFAAAGMLLAAVALVIDMPWGSITGSVVMEVTLVAVVLLISGILAGVPFIVLGQLVLVALDIHRLLGLMVDGAGTAARPAPDAAAVPTRPPASSQPARSA